MRVSAEFLNTDAVNVQITIEMTMGDWKALRAQLPTSYPGWKLGERIGDAVSKLEHRVVLSEESR